MRSRTLSLVPFGLVGALLSSPAAGQGQVHLVDESGAGNFVTIQEAVDQATPGDVILVRPLAELGDAYLGVTISKGVTVLGLGANAVVERIVVREVPPGPPVVLGNLIVAGSYTTFDGDRLRVERNLAPVWIEDCLLAQSHLGVELSDVVAVDLGIQAYASGTTRTGQAEYAPGIAVRDGRLAGYGLLARAGSGDYIESFEPMEGGDGGDGLRVRGSSHVVAGASAFHGGDGDHALVFLPPSIGGDAGAGISVDAASTVVLRASRASAGEPGFGDTVNGVPARVIEGTVLWAGGVAQSLSGITSAAESRSTLLVVTGAPGSRAYLTVSEEPAWEPMGLAGARLVGAPLGGAPIDLGIVPADGEVRASWTPPAQAAGSADVLHLQVSFDEAGTTSYGPARAVVVLDDAWLPGRVYVDAAAAPGGDGTSWASAFDDLHEGLAATAGLVDLPTEVWVREGVYTPAPANGDRAIHFGVESGTHVYGGFAGGETELDQRDPRAHRVVLSGDLNGDDAQPGDSMDENTRTVLIAGAARPTGPSPVRWPFPLVQKRRQNIRLDGLSIRAGNSASNYGDLATIYLSGDVALVGSEIAGHAGNLTFTCFGGAAEVLNCRFVGNRSRQISSTVVRGWDAGPTSGVNEFAGCEFVDNRFHYKLFDFNAKARFTNCTFYRNGAFSGGGSMILVNRGSATLSNCILWDNDFGQDFYLSANGSAHVAHSVYTGPYGTVGNVAGPPRFVHPAGPDGKLGTPDDDLRLGPHSPCTDAGDNAALPADRFDLDGDGDTEEPLPFDLAGGPRRVDDPLAPDTGNGTPPLVDMGARERQ